ncbi:MAG TPA: hypothetical protein IAA98_05560 [Candidatus Avipropionibacterium avicola]|uniref:Neutral/alkaline non-lysosomal ceramidase N-terminal domain-containing protein n=1 Tax=Candidatus Avipropionibacterium avicola TaxID=2840701 RepID=A0A9D1KN78_9ACTN|nr:hypothetical protein [Candidatus Avipropionibacterium avicola]
MSSEVTAPPLELGWDRREITPTWPTALAGFASRAAIGPAEEVVSPLHLRTVALRQGDDVVVMMVADMLWWGPDNMAQVQAEASQRYGLAPEQLVLQGTHTHSAPQPSQWFSSGLGIADPRWVDLLHQQAIAAIGAALEDLVEVRVDLAQGRYHLGVERRFARSAGKERAAELSELLSVITFRDTDGAPVATLFHHACHPTLHHGNAVSADFPGAAMGSLEENGSPIALYLQGCCGNVNPDRYEGTKFHSGDSTEILAMGTQLATAVRDLQPSAEPIHVDLSTDHSAIDLPTEPAPDQATLESIAAGDSLMTSSWAQLLLERPERRHGAPMVLTRVWFGDGLQLLGLSAEVTSPYANSVTAELGERALTLGYCNGMLCYVVSAMQQVDGGYEANDAPYWFGLPGPFTADLEPQLTGALLELGHRPAPSRAAVAHR